MSFYVRLREALRDFLKDQGLTLDDVVSAMDEDREGIYEAFKKRVWLSEEDLKKLDRLSSRQLNALLFVIQTFYIVNVSGLYKGRLIYPLRGKVMREGKLTKRGLVLVARELGMDLEF